MDDKTKKVLGSFSKLKNIDFPLIAKTQAFLNDFAKSFDSSHKISKDVFQLRQNENKVCKHVTKIHAIVKSLYRT